MTDDPRLTPADGDLRDRYAEALRLHYADEDALYCACGARIEDWDAHLADAVAAVRDTELERLRARVAELETTPVDWDAQRRRADELEATVERLRAELANVQRGADTWKDAADGWEERAERLTAERDEQRQRAEQAEATIARIRTAVINTYGEDYDGEDVAAEVERLLRHLSEYEANARRILAAKNDALERAEAAIDDTLWRMHQLRSWAYRDLSGDTMSNVLAVITNVLDCLDPNRTRGAALDASSAPESPSDAPTAPTRPDDTTQPHNGQETTP